MSDATPIFIVSITSAGQLTWQAKLADAELNLLLDGIKAQLVMRQRRETPAVIPASADPATMNRIKGNGV